MMPSAGRRRGRIGGLMEGCGVPTDSPQASLSRVGRIMSRFRDLVIQRGASVEWTDIECSLINDLALIQFFTKPNQAVSSFRFALDDRPIDWCAAAVLGE